MRESKVRERDLERRNAELLNVISVAAHDLKEPLRNLRASADRLKREHGRSLPPEARDLLQGLVGGARRGERLVEDLLLYSRLLSVPLRVELVKLEEPLQWALSNLRERIRHERAEVTHDPLPAVRADQGRMIQLFQNLILNALMYRGDDPARVHIGAEVSNGECVVCVSDRGTGIPKKDRARVFEPFQRLHSDERIPGSGLGLSICRGIVEGHSGSIWVESLPEGGTRLFFSVPT